MKCYYHNEKDGVSQCSSCWIFLCRECSDKYELDWKVICEKCVKKIDATISQEKRNVKKDLWIIAILWVIIVLWIGLVSTKMISEDTFAFFNFALYVGIFMLRHLIPVPRLFLMWWFWFWLIILCLYITWWMLYVMVIYPIKQYKIILSLFNK